MSDKVDDTFAPRHPVPAAQGSKKRVDKFMKRNVAHEVKQFAKMCPPDQAPVLTILRLHLLAEHYLERLLVTLLPRGDRLLENGSLTFAQKLALADALDAVDDVVIQSLKGLNKVRNGCAHEMEREITVADIERIGRPFGAEFTALRRKYVSTPDRLLMETLLIVARDLSGSVYYTEKQAAEEFSGEDRSETA